MIFRSPFLNVLKMSLLTVSFLVQLDFEIFACRMLASNYDVDDFFCKIILKQKFNTAQIFSP